MEPHVAYSLDAPEEGRTHHPRHQHHPRRGRGRMVCLWWCNAMLVVRVDLSSGVEVLWQSDDNDDNDGDDDDPLLYMQ